MKNLFAIFFCVLQFHVLFAQDDLINALPAYFKMADAKAFTRNMGELVEINLNGVKGTYSKTQAEMILKDFFRRNLPNDYQLVHQGATREGLYYTIGKYMYMNGTYQVYIVMRQNRGTYVIDSIDFTKE
ncbi:MAG: DUF4783 domain-containing protein [Cytophagaceae bacterium]|jgi:hypothetical protein|nr:DUF4783 domain-containing protein [Cytophagaceae bacterium]